MFLSLLFAHNMKKIHTVIGSLTVSGIFCQQLLDLIFRSVINRVGTKIEWKVVKSSIICTFFQKSQLKFFTAVHILMLLWIFVVFVPNGQLFSNLNSLLEHFSHETDFSQSRPGEEGGGRIVAHCRKNFRLNCCNTLFHSG